MGSAAAAAAVDSASMATAGASTGSRVGSAALGGGLGLRRRLRRLGAPAPNRAPARRRRGRLGARLAAACGLDLRGQAPVPGLRSVGTASAADAAAGCDDGLGRLGRGLGDGLCRFLGLHGDWLD